MKNDQKNEIFLGSDINEPRQLVFQLTEKNKFNNFHYVGEQNNLYQNQIISLQLILLSLSLSLSSVSLSLSLTRD